MGNMMKVFVIATAVVFGFFTYSANADEEASFKHQINLNAKVNPSCSFTGVVFDGNGFSAGNEPGQSTFTVQIIDKKASPVEGTISFTQFSCNAKLRVYLTGTGSLTNNVLQDYQGDFETKIPYNASIDPNGTENYVDMPFNGGGYTNDLFLMPSDGLGIQLKINVPESGVLSAGKYEDTLTINFCPQV
jgi:hypothetical protein